MKTDLASTRLTPGYPTLRRLHVGFGHVFKNPPRKGHAFSARDGSQQQPPGVNACFHASRAKTRNKRAEQPKRPRAPPRHDFLCPWWIPTSEAPPRRFPLVTGAPSHRDFKRDFDYGGGSLRSVDHRRGKAHVALERAHPGVSRCPAGAHHRPEARTSTVGPLVSAWSADNFRRHRLFRLFRLRRSCGG